MGQTFTTGITAVGGLIQAVQSFRGGSAQAQAYQQQANYNAQVYEQQAAMIASQKALSQEQARRSIGRMRGTLVAKTAGKGLLLSGSPLAIMADTESQMLFDQAINEYNLDVQAAAARSAAAMTRYSGATQASYAKTVGRANAFSGLLSTASQIGRMYYGGPGKL